MKSFSYLIGLTPHAWADGSYHWLYKAVPVTHKASKSLAPGAAA